MYHPGIGEQRKACVVSRMMCAQEKSIFRDAMDIFDDRLYSVNCTLYSLVAHTHTVAIERSVER